MGKKRTRWNAREKLKIVEEATASGNIAEVCRQYGISTAQFYDWRRRAKEGALEALGPRSNHRGPSPEERYEAELTRLRAVIAEITAENLDLKKTP